MTDSNGMHFLQIPGPSNVPGRILRALSRPTIDHRGPEFQMLTDGILRDVRKVFQTASPVLVFTASGTGAWVAALVNTLSPGDKVLMFETGHFAMLWKSIAEKLGLIVEFVAGDWRHGADPQAAERILAADKSHEIKAVCVVHNETSTGVASRIADLRAAIDRAEHPALFLVDTISSLGSIDYRHDEWGVDVTVCGSQKGLMLPPGLSFNAVSEKAVTASKTARLPKVYWAWDEMLQANLDGSFPYTPGTNLLYGLREAIDMLLEEGLDEVFARHARLGEATRQAVRAWGLEIQCLEPAEYSNSLTGVVLPEGADADRLRALILDTFNMSLGSGLGKLKGRVFRIGHLGYFNELMLTGTLCGVEMGLEFAGIEFRKGGVDEAMRYILGNRVSLAA